MRIIFDKIFGRRQSVICKIVMIRPRIEVVEFI